MPITDKLSQWISGLWARSRKSAWRTDLKVFAKTNLDPFNFSGLELALLHLKSATLTEPTVTQRRELKVFTSTQSVDQMLSLLSRARLFVISGDTIPKDFFPAEDNRYRRFDDYFVSGIGHTVSIEKVLPSLEGWTVQLISTLRELETEDIDQYNYYNRKFRLLYRDLYYVMTAVLETSFR